MKHHHDPAAVRAIGDTEWQTDVVGESKMRACESDGAPLPSREPRREREHALRASDGMDRATSQTVSPRGQLAGAFDLAAGALLGAIISAGLLWIYPVLVRFLAS